MDNLSIYIWNRLKNCKKQHYFSYQSSIYVKIKKIKNLLFVAYHQFVNAFITRSAVALWGLFASTLRLRLTRSASVCACGVRYTISALYILDANVFACYTYVGFRCSLSKKLFSFCRLQLWNENLLRRVAKLLLSAYEASDNRETLPSLAPKTGKFSI